MTMFSQSHCPTTHQNLDGPRDGLDIHGVEEGALVEAGAVQVQLAHGEGTGVTQPGHSQLPVPLTRRAGLTVLHLTTTHLVSG